MKKIILPLFLSFFLVSCQSNGVITSDSSDKGKPAIVWLDNLDNALVRAKNEKKIVMADFTAGWCGWCKKLDSDVFAKSDIAELAENMVCVKVNTDKYGNVARQYGVRGLPTILFLDSGGKVIEEVVGYRNKDDFKKIIEKVLDK